MSTRDRGNAMHGKRPLSLRLVSFVLLITWLLSACVTWDPVPLRFIPPETQIRVTTSNSDLRLVSDSIAVMGDTLVMWEQQPRSGRNQPRAEILRAVERDVVFIEAGYVSKRQSTFAVIGVLGGIQALSYLAPIILP